MWSGEDLQWMEGIIGAAGQGLCPWEVGAPPWCSGSRLAPIWLAWTSIRSNHTGHCIAAASRRPECMELHGGRCGVIEGPGSLSL